MDITCLIGRAGSQPRGVEDRAKDKTKDKGKQGSMEKAVKRARQPNFGTTLRKFRDRFFAKFSMASRRSKRDEVLKLAKAVAAGRPVLPLAKETVEGVVAALKEAGMKSGNQYLAELRLLHVEAGFEIEAWLKRVRVETEAVDKMKKVCRRKPAPQHGGLMFLWACIWMLRETEVRNMTIGGVSWNEQQKWAAIRLRVSKNDQEAEGVRRTLARCGRTPCWEACPVKLAITVASLAKLKTNTMGMPLFTDAQGLFISKRGVIASWKEGASWK
eukprot:s1341_g16.t1